MSNNVMPIAPRPAPGPQVASPTPAPQEDSADAEVKAGRPRGLLMPLGLLTVGLVAIIVVLLLFAAREQNELALDASRHLAASVLGTQRAELQSTVRDYATWDETVENVVISLDGTWADENIGIWIYEGLAVDASVAVDGAGAPIYAMLDGTRIEGADLLRRTAHLNYLIEAARNADVSEVGAAISAYVRVNGRLALAAAAPIIYEDTTPATQRGGASSVLVFIRLLDAEVLGELEVRFLLSGLRLLPADATAPQGLFGGLDGATALLPLTDQHGTVLANLAWQAEQPGFRLLRTLALPGALAGAIAAFLLWVIVRRSGKATRALQDSHAALQKQTAALRDARDRAREQTHVEAELRRRADAASRSKSEFLALVSHELRTPLNAILGFSETIATQAFGPAATERYREYARDIHESGAHLLSIINDILDLTKVEARRYELHEEEIDLGPLLDRCCALLRERASGKGVALVCAESNLRLCADTRALKQIVINLLTNAIKFTESGGRVELSAALAAEGIEIAVADSGIGMSPEDLERALQPFGQAASALTRSEEGTGLGLNITQALAELHGGRLELRSARGRGTTAVVHLPAGRLLSAEPNGQKAAGG